MIKKLATIALSAAADAGVSLGDIKELVKEAEALNIQDSVRLYADGKNMYLLSLEFGTSAIHAIQCGEHIPPEVAYDLLVDLHECS